MTTPADTPRTDAAYKDHEWDIMDHIPLEFARQLERELNKADDKVLELEAEVDKLKHIAKCLYSMHPRCDRKVAMKKWVALVNDAADQLETLLGIKK